MRLISFVLLLSLAACAGKVETRVNSVGISASPSASFAFDTTASAVLADAQAKVSRALIAKGYREAQPADLILQVTVSDRPASLELKNGVSTLSASAKKKRCAKREYRVGIVLTRIADGSEFYRANAAEFHCKKSIEHVLDSLLASALADLGSPKGAYVTKRSLQ
jgi:hypothetical protein